MPTQNFSANVYSSSIIHNSEKKKKTSQCPSMNKWIKNSNAVGHNISFGGQTSGSSYCLQFFFCRKVEAEER